MNKDNQKFQEDKIVWDEQNSKEIFDLFPFAILITNIKTRQNLYVNPKFTQIYGYKISEIGERDDWLAKAYPDENYRRYVETIWKNDLAYAEANESRSRILNVKNKSGQIVKTKFKLMNVRNEKAFIIAEDVSDKIKLESELRSSEEKYHHLFENSPFAILLLNNKGIIKECNSAAERLLGYQRKKIIQEKIKFISFISKKDHLLVANRVKSLNKRKTIPREDIQLIRKDGKKVWVSAKSSLVQLKEDIFFQIILIDITNRKSMEENLKKSESKYRKAYNYTQFLRDLFSHDVSNLFQSLYSIADLLELYLNKGFYQDISELPEDIKNLVKRGEFLVDNVDILTEIEGLPPSERIRDLKELILETIQKVEPEYGKEKLEITIDSPNNIPKVKGHKYLEEAFRNLLVNSIQHNINSPKKIKFQLSEKSKDDKDYVLVEITDNGIGISDEQKRNLFNYDNFFRAQKKRMGLGLLLVKQIMKEISGSIQIEDRVKGDHTKGTKFNILIPQA